MDSNKKKKLYQWLKSILDWKFENTYSSGKKKKLGYVETEG